MSLIGGCAVSFIITYFAKCPYRSYADDYTKTTMKKQCSTPFQYLIYYCVLCLYENKRLKKKLYRVFNAHFIATSLCAENDKNPIDN